MSRLQQARGEQVSALYAGLFLISAASLFFELTLTRLFAVTQWYHFAFISVSVALLGFGASGTWLALRQGSDSWVPSQTIIGERNRTALRRLAAFACFFSLGILIAYLAMNHVPFDSYCIAWERRQLLYLALYYPALIVPFFFAGLCIGLALATWPERAHALYAANLAGSAAGSLAMLLFVPLLGGVGAVLCASLLGILAALIFSLQVFTRRFGTHFVYLGICAALLVLSVHPLPWFALRLSPYKTLSIALLYPQAQLTFSRWNAFSRVDVVESAGIHAAPGLSLSFNGAMPRQLGLMVDGGNLSPITCLTAPGDEAFLQHLPTALPFLLQPRAQTLLIEPRAGLDLWAALYGGASSIVAVESNSLVVSAVHAQGSQCSASPYDDPRVTVVAEEARSYLRRSPQKFDVVLLSLADTYQPVISGAYSLSESYAYTIEAFVAYLQHLKEDGIFVVSRWLQSPPSEELRTCALVAEAMQRIGIRDAATRVIAFRSWSTVMIVTKRTPFRSDELALWKDFCAQRSYDLVYYDGMAATEANRYNQLLNTAHYDGFRRILSGGDRQAFWQQYPYEISPPSDDRPFFFHYFKWSQVQSILKGLGKTWQPFGGSGFLILVALLLLAIVLSSVLVLLPLAVRGRPSPAARAKPAQSKAEEALPRKDWGEAGKQGPPQSGLPMGPKNIMFLLYFACLGLGYLLVEMPLLQQFILFLGQPAYSFALVLFSILLFSGLGSSLSTRLPLRSPLGVLVGVVLVYPLFLSRLFALSIGWSLSVRLVVAVVSLGPLGFLLGLPLPAGVRLLQARAPQLIPWAWAANGCASVISSVLAAMGAVMFGFHSVLLAGALAYFVGWIIMLGWLCPARKA